MLQEELSKLVEAYDENNSTENLNAIRSFLKRHTICFRKYYNNTDGMDPIILNNFQDNGKFVDFTESIQFNIPSLLTVQKDNGEIVYVGMSDFTFE